ncbi:unnamed protein product [Rotaria magnacalcarata]|uniref:DDE Tnp4 domain-containing protein n=3 Tax=Rotaria magnacalcarata TaxID=392030 RepID=A0A815XEZ2_9BILA|nr:unnamed protein product [Rotaria magnacalcarata]CAF4275405.1 unnamed protein product [Rotaria magnacalcarata]
MTQVSKGTCCHCDKILRKYDRIYRLDKCQNLLQYAMTNGLVNLKLHHKCYTKLHKQQKTSENDSDQDQQMNVDLTTINAHLQTDPYSRSFTTSSIMDTSTSDIINATSAPMIIESTVLSNVVHSDSIELPYYRLSRSNQSCSICKINFSQKNRNCEYISEKIRAECLINHKIFISEKSRCCTAHICDDSLSEKDIEKIKNSTTMHCSIKQHELIEIFSLMKIMLQNLNTKIENIEKRPALCFDADSTFDASNYYVLTGLTLEQFDNLCSEIPSGVIRHSDLRSSRSAIACLLVKLRLGLSNDVLATLFGFRNRRDVGHVLDSARKALIKCFVPKHLGFNHNSREDVITNHTRPLAKRILADGEDKAILILDGTYIYIQKSAHNMLQRKTYSTHKGRPLVKTMMIVSTDGYIVSMLGPYFADYKNNDATITKNIIYNNKEDILDWLKPDDVLVVDRGFRDVLDDLHTFGYKTKMPCFLRDYFAIVCALINTYRPLFIADISKDDAIADRMLRLATQSNNIKTYVDRLKSKSEKSLKWTLLNAKYSVKDFPRMTFNELNDLTLGTFQLKQAKKYAVEHLSNNGSFNIKIAKQRDDLIRAQILSRHKSAILYDVWVQYNKNEILGWYCRCPNGCRVVGCCSHIASVTWFLSFARYHPEALRESASSYLNSITDAPNYSDVSDDDGNESDDDTSQTLYTLA